MDNSLFVVQHEDDLCAFVESLYVPPRPTHCDVTLEMILKLLSAVLEMQRRCTSTAHISGISRRTVLDRTSGTGGET